MPSCNTRRMAETAAHLTDHVFPRLLVRQWVLSVPKRLRYYMQRDGATLGMVLRIFSAGHRAKPASQQCRCEGGFSVDTSVCIAAQDRAGLERLLRYCARPPFALAEDSVLITNNAREFHRVPGLAVEAWTKAG